MTEAMATLVLGALLLTVLAGGVTYAVLQWLKNRTLLNIVRLGWFALLLALVLVVFLRHEPFAGAPGLMVLALAVGAVVFVVREVAARFDLQVLLVIDIALGLALLALVTWLIGPGSSLPLTTIVPGIALAAVAFAAQMMMRYWNQRGNERLAERARLTRIWSLLLIPVVVVITLVFFGAITPPAYRRVG